MQRLTNDEQNTRKKKPARLRRKPAGQPTRHHRATANGTQREERRKREQARTARREKNGRGSRDWPVLLWDQTTTTTTTPAFDSFPRDSRSTTRRSACKSSARQLLVNLDTGRGQNVTRTELPFHQRSPMTIPSVSTRVYIYMGARYLRTATRHALLPFSCVLFRLFAWQIWGVRSVRALLRATVHIVRYLQTRVLALCFRVATIFLRSTLYISKILFIWWILQNLLYLFYKFGTDRFASRWEPVSALDKIS